MAKAMHSIWSQDWKSNGVMVQKSVGHKSKRKSMRSLRLVNLPDGKVRMLCQMTKKRAEELKREGIAVDLIAPVDKVSSTSRRRAQKSRLHSELTLHDYREIQALLSAGGMVQTVDDTNQREEIAQMYWAVVDIARQMERVMLTVPDDDGHKPTGLFRDFVDEGKLAACFKKVSVDFYGIDRKEELKGSGRDVPTFMAYLFILVEHEHLGSGSFSEKGISPFFRFVKDQGIVNVQCTSRTFYNRLTDNLGIFRKRMQGESRDSRFQQDYWRRNIYLENFLKVREIFHATDYYNVLKPLLQ